MLTQLHMRRSCSARTQAATTRSTQCGSTETRFGSRLRSRIVTYGSLLWRRSFTMWTTTSCLQRLTTRMRGLFWRRTVCLRRRSLDALGAVGVARTFAYGGEHGRPMDDSIRHFHDKLLHLKSLMNTETGRRMAEKRHAFLEAFLEEYIAETS